MPKELEAQPYEQIVEAVLDRLTASTSPLNDRSVGSVTRTLAEAFAWEVATLQRQVVQAYLWGFVDTAEGDALDRVVALLGVVRHKQDTAVGQVTFYRRAGVTGDITIAAGTRLSTENPQPVLFETAETLKIGAEEATGTVQIRALEAGPPGVVPAGAITLLNRPVAGIIRVENVAPTALGAPTETDANLRERAKRALERAGKATVNAIRYGMKEVPGVRGVLVAEDPEHDPGVVRVTVDLVDEQDAGARSRAIAALDDLRAAGIRARHNLGAGQQLTDIGLAVELLLTFESDSLAPEVQDAAAHAVRTAVEQYFAALEVGQAVSLNRLLALAMAAPSVANVQATVATRTAPVRRPGPDGQLLPGPDERFHLEELLVEPARRPVYLDITVRAEVPGEIGLTAAQAEEEIRRTLEALLVQAREQTRSGPAVLTVEELSRQLGAGKLYQITWLQVDATYPERALYVQNVARVELAQRDAPQVRNWSAAITLVSRGGGGS